MKDNINEIIKCYFKQKDIIELKNNKKEKVGNAYLDFFVRRGSTTKKPEFNTGILFIIEILIISMFLSSHFPWWIFILINIAIIIALIISHKMNLNKWEFVNKEYLKITSDNQYLLDEINKKIKYIENKHKEFMPYDRILQNKILNNEILTFDDAELFLLNNIKTQPSICNDYWVCDYCGTYNEIRALKCISCGSSKKLNL